MVAAELGWPTMTSADPTLEELLDHAREANRFAGIVNDALRSFDLDGTPMAMVSVGVIDLALADGIGPGTTAGDAAAAYQDVVADIERGDDLGMSNGELNRVDDRLAGLDPEARALVLDNLTGDQLQVLFHNVHSSGFWSNDWDDRERGAFYTMLREVDPASLQRITNDPAILADIAEETSTDDYLDILVALNTDHGAGAFPSAADADELIRTLIPGDYLTAAVADGRQAEGNLAIVDEANFVIAYEANRGEPPRPTLNGFVDREGRQWVRATRANWGTPIHEAIHNYSEPELIRTSQPLNEGVTEYFTRLVTDQIDDPSTTADEAADVADARTTIYASNLGFTERLVQIVGEDVVAAAYFDGEVDELRTAFLIETGLPEDSWDSMISHTRDDDWASAINHLFPPDIP